MRPVLIWLHAYLPSGSLEIRYSWDAHTPSLTHTHTPSLTQTHTHPHSRTSDVLPSTWGQTLVCWSPAAKSTNEQNWFVKQRETFKYDRVAWLAVKIGLHKLNCSPCMRRNSIFHTFLRPSQSSNTFSYLHTDGYFCNIHVCLRPLNDQTLGNLNEQTSANNK